jgi:hypothetical protein
VSAWAPITVIRGRLAIWCARSGVFWLRMARSGGPFAAANEQYAHVLLKESFQFSGGSAGGAQEESGRRVPSPETFGPSVPPGSNVPLAQQGLRLVPTMMLGRLCLVAAQGGSVANVPGSIAVSAHSGFTALNFESSDPLQRNAGAVEPWDFLFLALGVLALGLVAHAGASLRHQTPGERERERLNGPANLWAASRLLRAFRRSQ